MARAARLVGVAALAAAAALPRGVSGMACASFEAEAECKGCTDAGQCTWTEDGACEATKVDGCGMGEGGGVAITVFVPEPAEPCASFTTSDECWKHDACTPAGTKCAWLEKDPPLCAEVVSDLCERAPEPMPLPTGGGDPASSSGSSGSSAGSAPSGPYPCAEAMDIADAFVKCTATMIDKEGASAVAKDFVPDRNCMTALNTLAEVSKYVADGLAGCDEPVPDTLMLTAAAFEAQASQALACIPEAPMPEPMPMPRPMPMPEPGTGEVPNDTAVSYPVDTGDATKDDAVQTFAPGAPETQRGNEGTTEEAAAAGGPTEEATLAAGPTATPAAATTAAASTTRAATTAASTTQAAPSTAAPAPSSAFRSDAAVLAAALGGLLALAA